MEWLAIWGVAQAVGFVFRPILEDLAKDVAKDAAKSYVGKCFQSVFSVIHRNPLTRATGLALKELLELIQNEMLDADLDHEQLQDWIDDVQRFTKHNNVRQAIASLFLDPDYQFDPKTFAATWQQMENVHSLPDEFSWQRIAKRFARKVVDIRQSSKELQQTFISLSQERMSDDIRQLAGLPPDFDLETYREALIERFGNLNFEILDTTGAYYSSVRLWSVFVPQSVIECHGYYPQLLEIPKEHQKRLLEKGEIDQAELAETEKMLDVRRREYFSQPLRPVLEVTDDQSFQRTVILGDPGSGKSSLLRYLALRWAQVEDANLRYTQPLPLLIELRDYNRWQCPSGKSFACYLHKAPTWHRLNQITLDHLLKQPDRVVLLLDGLDEIFDPVQRDKVINDIHRFSNQFPETRIIVTSRVVGYKPQRLRDADFRHLMLQDLSLQQIDDFIDRWHDVTFDDATDAGIKRERLKKAIRDSKPIAMLAGNPLLLTMMAILNRNQKLPDDRVDLYQQATRVLLQQWDTERALIDFPGLSSEIGLREKTDILRRVAFTMQSEPAGLAGNIIDEQTLANLIEDYLHDELHFAQAKSVTRVVVEQLRVRNFILCFMGADSYAFVHRTFLEYFCAAEFVHQFNVAKTLNEKGLIALFDQHCRDDEWREVLRLICGQIDEQFVGQIVEHLATRTDLEKCDGGTSLPELPLAIWCLSEVRNKNKLESSGKKLLDVAIKVYLIGNGETIRSLLDAAKELGSQWPSGQKVANLAKAIIKNLSFVARLYWPQFVAALYPDRVLTLEFMASELDEVRWDAIEALANNWPDDATRNLIRKRAIDDKSENPRGAAIRMLAKHWPGETTRKLLSERAV